MLAYDVVSGFNPRNIFAAGMVMRGNVLKQGFYRAEPERQQELLEGALSDLTKLFACEDEKIAVFLAVGNLGATGDRLVAPSGFLIERTDLDRMIRARFESPAQDRPDGRPESSATTAASPIEGFEPDELDFGDEVAEGRSSTTGQSRALQGLPEGVEEYVAWLQGIRDTMEREGIRFALVMHRPSLMTFLHEFAHYLQKTGRLFGSRDQDELEAEARSWSHTVFFVMSPYQYKKAVEKRRFFHFQNLPLPPIGHGETFVSFKQGLSRWQEYFLAVFVPEIYPGLSERGIELVSPVELARGMPEEFQRKVAEAVELLGLESPETRQEARASAREDLHVEIEEEDDTEVALAV